MIRSFIAATLTLLAAVSVRSQDIPKAAQVPAKAFMTTMKAEAGKLARTLETAEKTSNRDGKLDEAVAARAARLFFVSTFELGKLKDDEDATPPEFEKLSKPAQATITTFWGKMASEAGKLQSAIDKLKEAETKKGNLEGATALKEISDGIAETIKGEDTPVFERIGGCVEQAKDASMAGDASSGIGWFKEKDWSVWCWNGSRWETYPVKKMNVKKTKGCIEITNTTGIHGFAHISLNRELDKDFEISFDIQGDTYKYFQ
jgi:hypothetical protein